MAVILNDRPAEQVKEEVIETLIHNYSHGIISNEAFERRLDAVIAANSNQERVDQVSDLSPAPDDTIRRHKEQTFKVAYTNERVNNTENLVSILGNSDRSGIWDVPKEIRIFTLLGSSKLDFTNARFSSPRVTVKVFCLLGGDKIHVPEHVNIVSKAFCILGSVKNKAASIADQQSPTVTIEGVVILSDLVISVKQTVKEKFVAFANQMKAIFDDGSNRHNHY